MPLYSASNLVDKTMLLNKKCNIYLLSEINTFGDKAKPVFVANKGYMFKVWSYILETIGYTNTYGIAYAKRTYPYFVFKKDNTYYCIAIIGDGRFSIDTLQQQGALNVKEQKEKDEREVKEGFMPDFPDFGLGNIDLGKIITIGAILLLIFLLLPFAMQQVGKVKTKPV